MKAVVLEVRGRKAAILTADGAVRVMRGRYEVGQELEFYEPVRSGARQWVAAVVVAAILLAGSAGLWVNNNYVAYAEVSLDVNPSIVYMLNRRNRVLSVRAANADAQPLVDALSGAGIRFTPLPEAVGLTLDKLDEAGYLKEDDGPCVLASVSADDESQRETLAAQVEHAITQKQAGDENLEYLIERTDRATARAARESGMSPGRYSAWQQTGKGDDRETYAEKSVRQILEDTRRASHDGDRPDAPAPGEAPEGEAAPETPPESGNEPQPLESPKVENAANPIEPPAVDNEANPVDLHAVNNEANSVEPPTVDNEAKPVEPPAANNETKPVEPPVEENEAKPVESPAVENEAKPVESPAAESEAQPNEAPKTEDGVQPVEPPAADDEAKPSESPKTEDEAQPAEPREAGKAVEPKDTPGTEKAVEPNAAPEGKAEPTPESKENAAPERKAETAPSEPGTREEPREKSSASREEPSASRGGGGAPSRRGGGSSPSRDSGGKGGPGK